MISKNKQRVTIAVPKDKVEEFKIKAIQSKMTLGEFMTEAAENYDGNGKYHFTQTLSYPIDPEKLPEGSTWQKAE